jgi:TRAP-type C4-dicarboxylate transport system permease small subunit
MRSLPLFLIQFSDWVDRFVKIITIPIGIGTILIVFFEVLMRYVFRTPIITSIELARLGFVWSCFMGATLCMKQEKHIKFVFMIEKFGVMGQRVIKICVDLLSVGFFSFLLVKGIQMVQAVQYTYFPALGWSQLWLYLPLPLSAACMLIFGITFLARDTKNLKS